MNIQREYHLVTIIKLISRWYFGCYTRHWLWRFPLQTKPAAEWQPLALLNNYALPIQIKQKTCSNIMSIIKNLPICRALPLDEEMMGRRRLCNRGKVIEILAPNTVQFLRTPSILLTCQTTLVHLIPQTRHKGPINLLVKIFYVTLLGTFETLEDTQLLIGLYLIQWDFC